MEQLKNVTIIADKLSSLLYGYIREFRSGGNGFEEFSDEAIMYALLEYSKFPRHFSRAERIVYIHDKCIEFEGKTHIRGVGVEFDEQYGDYFIIVYPQCSDLPF